jgi:hypothetical protein
VVGHLLWKAISLGQMRPSVSRTGYFARGCFSDCFGHPPPPRARPRASSSWARRRNGLGCASGRSNREDHGLQSSHLANSRAPRHAGSEFIDVNGGRGVLSRKASTPEKRKSARFDNGLERSRAEASRKHFRNQRQSGRDHAAELLRKLTRMRHRAHRGRSPFPSVFVSSCSLARRRSCLRVGFPAC